eukprot:Tamp_24640.p4 GENE.Tamp_24640~~Tamp_24640.p4  ORF type:complete len:102 (-),score=17.78 Tamp_24640:15-320(-)
MQEDEDAIAFLEKLTLVTKALFAGGGGEGSEASELYAVLFDHSPVYRTAEWDAIKARADDIILNAQAEGLQDLTLSPSSAAQGEDSRKRKSDADDIFDFFI